MKILVTGAAGFIGFHVSMALLARGDIVIGIDNLNDYYDVALKQARLDQITGTSDAERFHFIKADITDRQVLDRLFSDWRPDRVVHLAAQAGVRYSIENPQAYIQSNLVGFGHLLDICRNYAVEHLVYASSSSVYGANIKQPFSELDCVDHPVSLYAATKKANELMAHAYSHLYQLPTTGLRFFTVYGPWGRPDMSPFLFSAAILAGKPIKIFNYGDMMRDFTYIDDIVEGMLRIIDKPAVAENPPMPSLATNAPYRIFNIGNSKPEKLTDFIEALENALGRKALKEFLPLQPGDVKETYADMTALEAWVDFRPTTPLQTGIEKFAQWYLTFYGETDFKTKA